MKSKIINYKIVDINSNSWHILEEIRKKQIEWNAM